MFGKLFPPKKFQQKHQQEKKREEKKLFAGTRIIVLSDFSEHFDQWGKKRVPGRRDLGRVVETVMFLAGGEAGVMVKVMLLKLPAPEDSSRGDKKEEWQTNDFHPILAIEDKDPVFRDYRMLMRLDARTDLLWVDGETVVVSYSDIRQATYVEWMKLVVAK